MCQSKCRTAALKPSEYGTEMTRCQTALRRSAVWQHDKKASDAPQVGGAATGRLITDIQQAVNTRPGVGILRAADRCFPEVDIRVRGVGRSALEPQYPAPDSLQGAGILLARGNAHPGVDTAVGKGADTPYRAVGTRTAGDTRTVACKPEQASGTPAGFRPPVVEPMLQPHGRTCLSCRCAVRLSNPIRR